MLQDFVAPSGRTPYRISGHVVPVNNWGLTTTCKRNVSVIVAVTKLTVTRNQPDVPLTNFRIPGGPWPVRGTGDPRRRSLAFGFL